MQSRIMAVAVGVVVCATAGAARAATEPHPVRWVKPGSERSLSVVQPAPIRFGSVQPNPRTWNVIAPNPRMFARGEPNPRHWGKVQPKPRFWSVPGSAAEPGAVGRWGAVQPNPRVAGAIGRWGGVVASPRQWSVVQPKPPRFRRVPR